MDGYETHEKISDPIRLQNFHIRTPLSEIELAMDWSAESTPEGFCALQSELDPEPNICENRIRIWRHVLISVVAGVCMVIP